MPLPTIAGVVRCSVRGTLPGNNQWVNVIHARYAGGASTPGPTEIAGLDASLLRLYSGAAFAGGAAWLVNCQNQLQLNDITYYKLDNASPPILIAHPVSGTGGALAMLPQQTALALTIRTAFRGRRYRGRIYLPAPLASVLQTNGNWNTTVITATKNQWIGVVADLVAKQWTLGIASYGRSWINDPADQTYPKNKILSTWAPFYTEQASVDIDAKPDVQRRRK